MSFHSKVLLVVGVGAIAACSPRPGDVSSTELASPSTPPPTATLSLADIARTDEAATEVAQLQAATAEAAATQTEAAKTPTATPTPEVTATPAWTLIEDFSDLLGGAQEVEIPMHEPKQNVHFPDSACPIDIAGYSLDVLVEDTGAKLDFAAHLDLHGIGKVASWYAQIGYTYTPPARLEYYCQAYSTSSDAERYWRSLGQAPFDTWTKFEIDVVPIEGDWNYAFRYLINGEQVCYFQPPDEWDGNNRYEVIWRGLEVWLRDFNPDPIPIRVQMDNYEGYVSPACGPPVLNP